MKVTILASGSKGNAIYVEGEEGSLLIDAGLSAREIRKRIGDAGGDESDLRGILVTHEHTDHIKGADVLARKFEVPVVGTGGTLAGFLDARTSTKPVATRRVSVGDPFRISGFSVIPFSTAHDAAEPCGYRLEADGVRVGCCLDTGIVTPRIERALGCCDVVVLESNHCPRMLDEGPYPAFLKARIRSKLGHLSNNAAATCLSDIGEDLSAVMLAHLSEVNNTPEKAEETARDVSHDGIEHLIVGDQHAVSETVRI
ncbi:MBL fold metallo-hydrolase [Methanofollis aquaemaris]|uniref:MBL fold metallo-hydrolase n=1 Tax=Methanofollis aquaemaris TaxID=126734 RepID=A0A8A3S6L3_9EURY|nr:MBL fold metallo-hydrolase [Methanofollis aquaemaris]QSZ67692.1 MBL fold metallo-hydrolase [Methanofollis aquaemaris]